MSGPDRRVPNWSRLDRAQSHLFPVTPQEAELDVWLRSLSDQQLLGAIKVGRARAEVARQRARVLHETDAHQRQRAEEALATAEAELIAVEIGASAPVTDAGEGTP